jgi:hypothetical protein
MRGRKATKEAVKIDRPNSRTELRELTVSKAGPEVDLERKRGGHKE